MRKDTDGRVGPHPCTAVFFFARVRWLSDSGMDWSGFQQRLHTPRQAGSIPAPANMADGSTSSPQGDLTESIAQNAQGPASAESDGFKVTQHLPTQQIAADKHVGAKAAGKNPAKALVRMKIVPSGAV